MLTDNVDSIVGVVMEEVGATANQQFVFMAWALDFVRSMQKDVQTMIPDRNKETFYEFETFGYHEVRLPGDYYDYISVGTQIGHYVKGLAMNNRVTSHKKQPDMFPLLQNTIDNVWYWGGLYGYGMNWGSGGPIDAYGNGGDYGDFTIDYDRRLLITSPTFRFKNIVLNYYTNCITPSEETCIHPWFIEAMKNYLYYKYYFFRGDARWQASKLEYENLYLYAVQSKYRMKIPTIVKIVERIRGYRHG
jgi:hypothetical protein